MTVSRLSAAVCCGLLIAAPVVLPNANAMSPVPQPPAADSRTVIEDDDPCSLISDLFDAMNAGDYSRAQRMFVRHPVIIDPFPPPYVWHSFAGWRAASIKVQAQRHLSDFRMQAMQPLSVSGSSEGSAYCDPIVITSFKASGQAHRWRGIVTFTTVRVDRGWRISGFVMATNELESFWKTFSAEPAPPQ